MTRGTTRCPDRSAATGGRRPRALCLGGQGALEAGAARRASMQVGDATGARCGRENHPWISMGYTSNPFIILYIYCIYIYIVYIYILDDIYTLYIEWASARVPPTPPIWGSCREDSNGRQRAVGPTADVWAASVERKQKREQDIAQLQEAPPHAKQRREDDGTEKSTDRQAEMSCKQQNNASATETVTLLANEAKAERKGRSSNMFVPLAKSL